jgi:hypothetical protein
MTDTHDPGPNPNNLPNYLVPKQRDRLRPRIEMAIRLYATGQVDTIEAAAKLGKCSATYLSEILNTPAGQGLVNKIQGELDFKYQTLYSKFINIVGNAMDHPDPAVALAGANLFAKTRIGQKIKVELSAEDVVKSIVEGTYQEA